MRASITLLAVLAIGLVPCISGGKFLSNSKNRNARPTFKKLDKLFGVSKRTRRQAEQCHFRLQASETFQEFSSPTNAVGVYEHNQDCQWWIGAPADKVVVLQFKMFSVEGISGCLFDYVLVNNTLGAISAPLCGIGPNCEGNFPFKQIVSNENVMIVSFVTDFGIAYPGFTAQYRYADSTYRASPFTTTNFTSSCTRGVNRTSLVPAESVVTNCSGELVTGTNNKRLQLNYTNNMRCHWVIKSETLRVGVKFIWFSLEGISGCLYDYMMINDSQGEQLSGRLCGQGVHCSGNFPNRVYASSGRNISVGLFSDASIVSGGFILEYFEVDFSYVAENFTTMGNSSSSCNVTETSSQNGTITTNWDNTGAFQANCSRNLTATSTFQSFFLTTRQFYHNNARCQIKIICPGKVVLLRFTKFDVEFGNNCIYDRVVVMTSTGDPPAVFCGSRAECHEMFPVTELVSSSNNMTVTFTSDASVIGRGFEAEYKCEEPGYEADDYIAQGSPGMAESCQSETTTPAPPPQAGPCMFNLTATPQVQYFSTPRTSHSDPNYPSGVQCNWQIYTTSDTAVKLTFVSFDLESAESCNYDKTDVLDELGPLTHTLCGQGLGCPGNFPEMELLSRTNYMRVEFQSDGSVSHRGFNVSFQAVDPTSTRLRNISREVVGNPNVTCLNNTRTQVPQTVFNCSKNLTATDRPQILRSHDSNSSRTYSSNMLCIMYIVAPRNKRILIEFDYFDLEGDNTCSYDSVSLASSPEVVDERFCGNGYYCLGNFPKREYVSAGNHVYFIFRTDGSVTFSGFEAKYRLVDESYVAQRHVPDENTTLTAVQCSTCPEYAVVLQTSTRFSIPSSPAADVYPNNLECKWEMTTNNSALVNLTLFRYDIEESDGCIRDALIIWGDNFQDLRLCGFSDQPRNFLLTAPVFMDFTTNSEMGGGGFEAFFEAAAPTTSRRRRALPRLFRKQHNHS